MEIFFQTHEGYIGIGDFSLSDLDGDGLDEIIFVEKIGGIHYAGGTDYRFVDREEYIRILRWNGKKYESAWTSPAIKTKLIRKRWGSKLLVDDVKGTGKKQIVIGTGHGTIQVWEMSP